MCVVEEIALMDSDSHKAHLLLAHLLIASKFLIMAWIYFDYDYDYDSNHGNLKS